MAFYVYNTKNQALNSGKLSEIISFATDDFAGIIADGWGENELKYPTWIPYPEVTNPTGNPSEKYYEHQDGVGYFPSEDTSVQSGKTYYECRNCWRWNSALWGKQITFVGGGINIGYDVPEPDYSGNGGFYSGYWPYPGTDTDTYIYGVDVIVPGDNSSISSNAGRVWLTWAKCTSISKSNIYSVVENPSGDPNTKGYYEYNGSSFVATSDTQVNSDKVYYYAIKDEAITVNGASFVDRVNGSFLSPKTFKYSGNTVWIQNNITYNGVKANRFFIPLCYRDKNSRGGWYSVSVVSRRDKKGYASFLSAGTYYNLLKELGNQFVHRTGGTEKGDIGYLNITNNVIKNRYSDKGGGVVLIDKPKFDHVPIGTNTDLTASGYPVTSLMLALDRTNSGNNTYKCVPYATPNNWYVPRNHGGTGAVDTDTARKNFHFYYGSSIPTSSEETGRKSGYYYIKPKKLDGSLDFGSVWFRIV